MTVIATTTVKVLRGATTDDMGDSRKDYTAVAGMLEVALGIAEKSRKVYLPESDELRTVRYGVGRGISTLDIRKGDRLEDNRTGRVWQVNELIGGDRNIAGQTDLVLDLRAV